MLWLLQAHVVLIVFGYTAQDRGSALSEVRILLFDPQDVLKAAVALVLLATGISARQARRRVRYETWHSCTSAPTSRSHSGFSIR